MASILGKTWTIRMVTENAPFQPDTEVEITQDARVRFNGQEHQGTRLSEKKVAVVVVNPPSGQEHWEFVVSEETGAPPFVMYGFSRTQGMTKPDAMGSWVSDPQGTPAPQEPL